MSILEVSKENDNKADLMNQILEFRFLDLNQEFDACSKLLTLSQVQNDNYGIAFAYAYLGDYFIGKNESILAYTNLVIAKALCEKYNFTDLLLSVSIWLGIYYEMQNDRQMAMELYLNALEIAQQNNDISKVSILYNNIASLFENCGNNAIAKKYYIKAFEHYKDFASSDKSKAHFVQIAANVISICCKLKEIEEAKYYLSLLKKIPFDKLNICQLYLGELMIAAELKDIKTAQKNVDNLLIELDSVISNLQQFFEIFLKVADSMILLNEKEYAHKLLIILQKLCGQKEYGRKLEIQYAWIHYYEKFGSEQDCKTAYKDLYEIRKMNDATFNKNLSDGLLSKIELREVIKNNEEMKKVSLNLEGQMRIDELTQIYNRKFFRETTEKFVRDPNVNTLCIILIDADYFKQYNDTYGHAQGDICLKAIADSLKKYSSESIFCFRCGGDEFVSLCVNMTHNQVIDYIHLVSTDLYLKKISHKTSLCSDQLTLSIGYSLCTRNDEGSFDLIELMLQADKALYAAKGNGRNCFKLFKQV